MNTASRSTDTRRPRVSIGMPVYNGARWLAAAIEAQLAQTYGDFELIIADNRSTDDSWAICQGYAARDPRIRLIRNARTVGAYENFNVVFRPARGEYFRWASCNDLSAPTLLERCVAVLDDRPDFLLCHARTRLIDAQGTVIEDYPVEMQIDDAKPVARYRQYLDRVRLNNVEQGLVRREVLAGSMLQRNFLNNDTLLMAELTLYGKFHEVPEFLFFRRMGTEATTKFRTNVEIAEFYQPSRGPLTWQAWRWFSAQAGMIVRAPLGWREKAELWSHFLRMIRWSLGRKGSAKQAVRADGA